LEQDEVTEEVESCPAAAVGQGEAGTHCGAVEFEAVAEAVQVGQVGSAHGGDRLGERDAPVTKSSPQVGVAVAFVHVKLVGPSAAGTATTADRRYRRDERLQSKIVVGVRRGDGDCDRQTGSVGDEVDLRSLLAAIGRIRSSQEPARADKSSAQVTALSVGLRLACSKPLGGTLHEYQHAA
jgi:hypothetical protein